MVISAAGQTPVTVAQLEQFLTSRQASKLSDEEIANRLNRSELSEQLTGASLARILNETKLGPKTEEQLEIMAAASLLQSAPARDVRLPVPDAARQQELLNAAREYVSGELHLLPDLLAMRVTRAFDNLPVLSEKKHGKLTVQMHFVREFRSEIAVRHGREVNRAAGGDAAIPDPQPTPAGLSSWGEFGSILAIVLSDSFSGNVQWDRWQRSETGKQIAVFQYRIPQSASHYTVDFCCYRKSQDDPIMYPFHEKPGYQGEIYVDAPSGRIDRITLRADLRPEDPVTKSAIAVQYGEVIIDGKHYVCPIRSVAISELPNRAIEKIDGVGVERHLNEERFSDYHKFGSTMRIVTGGLQEVPR